MRRPLRQGVANADLIGIPAAGISRLGAETLYAPADMTQFIDLEGASGAQYRFRLWPEGAPHVPMAGNYVFVRREPDRFTVLAVGESNDLSLVRADWPKAEKRGATHVYTRLNVPRTVREAEHADLAANYQTARASEAAN